MRKTKSSKIIPFTQGHLFVSSHRLNTELMCTQYSFYRSGQNSKWFTSYDRPRWTGRDGLELCSKGVASSRLRYRECCGQLKGSPSGPGRRGDAGHAPRLFLSHLSGKFHMTTNPKHKTKPVTLHRISLNY